MTTYSTRTGSLRSERLCVGCGMAEVLEVDAGRVAMHEVYCSSRERMVAPGRTACKWAPTMTPQQLREIGQERERKYRIRRDEAMDVQEYVPEIPPCAIVPSRDDPERGVLMLSAETLQRIRDGEWASGEPSMWVKRARELRAAKKHDVFETRQKRARRDDLREELRIRAEKDRLRLSKPLEARPISDAELAALTTKTRDEACAEAMR